MAASATIKKYTKGGRLHVRVTVVETDSTASTEWSQQMPSPLWRIVSYKATLTAGTGTTINPILGRAAAFSADTQDHLGTNSGTAAHINDQTALVIDLLDASLLVGRSTANDATADHDISTEILLVEGAQP